MQHRIIPAPGGGACVTDQPIEGPLCIGIMTTTEWHVDGCGHSSCSDIVTDVLEQVAEAMGALEKDPSLEGFAGVLDAAGRLPAQR